MPSMRQRYLQKPVSGRLAGAVWIGTLALFVVYLDYIAPLKAMGGGAVHLDIRFGGYDLATVNAYFATLGETGRAFYRTTTLFDTVWPLAVAISGFLMAPLAFRRVGSRFSSHFPGELRRSRSLREYRLAHDARAVPGRYARDRRDRQRVHAGEADDAARRDDQFFTLPPSRSRGSSRSGVPARQRRKTRPSRRGSSFPRRAR